MTDREKLIKLLNKAHAEYYAKCDFSKGYMETLADYLLVNGVTFAEGTNGGCRWISVEDGLPEIVAVSKTGQNIYRRSTRVLCACLQADGKRMVKEGYMEFFNDYPKSNWRIPGTIHSVTHWMPLPKPPLDTTNQAADL